MAYDGALKFDTKIDPNGFTSGVAQLKSVALSAIGAIGGAFATGAIAKALVGQIGLVEKYGSAINDQAQRISVSTKAYQELSYIFEQTGGNADVLQTGIKTLSNAVVDGSKAFDTLGISIEDARKMSQEDLFNLVLQQLAGMEEGSERTAAAVDLLGRSATELNPLFNMGAAGIAKMRQEAQNYGLVMSEEAVAATDRFGDAQTLAQKSGEALRNAMVGKMMPALTDIALGFADIAKESTQAFNSRGIAGVVDVITSKFPVATAAVSGLTAAFASLMIIKGVTAVMVAFQTAQVSLALGMMGTTAATLLQTGALTANEIIVGVLTGKIKIAAAAQALWNTVMLANPVGLLVTAIGLLVGGLVLINKNFDKINPQMAEYTQNTKEAAQQTKQLNGNMRESADSYAETIDGIDRQTAASKSLINTLYEMSAAYQGSGIEQRKMQAIVDELNGLYAGLDLAYDSNTGKINQNRAAVESLVAAKQEEARATADIERSVALIKEESDAKYNLYVAQDNYNKLAKTGADKNGAAMRFAAKAVREAQTAYDGASESVRQHNEYLDENDAKIIASAESLNALKEAERALADETERVIVGGYDVTDVLDDIGMTADEVSARLDNFTSAATNMFERISTESKIKVADMIANLEANAIAIEDWGDNIAYLGGKLPSDLLQPLVDAGPQEMAGALSELAGASDEQLSALSEAFASGGEEAKEAWLLSLGAGIEEENPLLGVLEGAEEAAAESGEAFGKSLITSIKAQNYSGATSSLTDAFKRSFQDAGNAFHTFLDRVHFDLAYAIGGVRIDLAYMASEVRAALAKIPTQITIHVNVVYGTSGSVGGVTGTTGQTGVLGGRIGGGVYAPITVQGVVESDTQLANRITNQFNEVVYGRNS